MLSNQIFIAIPSDELSLLIKNLNFLSSELDATISFYQNGHWFKSSAQLLSSWSKLLASHLKSSSISDLNTIVAIQCQEGNWNFDPYMHGMANGLILAHSIVNHVHPELLDSPQAWISKNNSYSFSYLWHSRWPLTLRRIAVIHMWCSKLYNGLKRRFRFF